MAEINDDGRIIAVQFAVKSCPESALMRPGTLLRVHSTTLDCVNGNTTIQAIILTDNDCGCSDCNPEGCDDQ